MADLSEIFEDLDMDCLNHRRESSVLLMRKVLQTFESNGFKPSDVIYGLMVNIYQKGGYWMPVAADLEKAQMEAYEKSERLDRMESINGLD